MYLHKTCASLIGAWAAMLLLVQPADANPPTAVDPGTKVLGKTLGEWADAWIRWSWNIPTAQSPFFDEEGQFCDVDQKGGVWFLAGVFESKPVQPQHRSCTIPRGKYIFFLLGGSFSFPPEFPEPEDPCSQRNTPIGRVRCDAIFDVRVKDSDPLPAYGLAGITDLNVFIDGERLSDPFAYHVASPPGGFRLFFREGSFAATEFGLVGERKPVAHEGFGVMLSPPAPGKHTIRMLRRHQGGAGQDVTWTIRIP